MTPTARRRTSRKRPAKRRTHSRFGRIATAGLIALFGWIWLAGADGVVVDKTHSSGVRSCTGTGVTRSCTTSGECWRLHLRGEDGEVRRVCVDAYAWLRTGIGDNYDGGRREWP
jgi:hypothetical protein